MFDLGRKAIRNVAWVLLAVTAIGCGGGGASAFTPQGKLGIRVVWPPSQNTSGITPKVIPTASNSINVVVTQHGHQVATALIVRPDDSVNLVTLPIGSVTVTATAYPNADGTGVAQAVAQTTATINDGLTTNISLTLGSTITHVVVAPAPCSMVPGDVSAFTATPKDVDENVVLVAPGNITWDSSDTAVATVDASGNVTAVDLGTSTIRATELDSAVAGTSSLTVHIGVVITPASFTLGVLDTKQLTATVTGAHSDNTVTWTVEAGGGSVSNTGLYTAPASAGDYTVTATSNEDGAQFGTAIMHVRSGGGNITIH